MSNDQLVTTSNIISYTYAGEQRKLANEKKNMVTFVFCWKELCTVSKPMKLKIKNVLWYCCTPE